MFEKLKKDIEAVRERDPAARNSFEVLLTSSGLHAILLHRPANWLYKRDHFLCARVVSQLARFATGIEIHPGAKIGSGVLIDHGMGVVIGETAEIGDGCTIYQGVTLGGTGKDKGKRHPTLGKNVTVGCGAKILGPFKVGDGAKVAANAVLLESIPANATAVGVPARVARVGGHKASLDHVHLPDPVAQELCRLQSSVDKLERRIGDIEKSGGALAVSDKKNSNASVAERADIASGENHSDATSAKTLSDAAPAAKTERAPTGRAKSPAADTKKKASVTEADSVKAEKATASGGADAGKTKAAEVSGTKTTAAKSSAAGKKAPRGRQSHHPVPSDTDITVERAATPALARGDMETPGELPAAVEMEHPVPTAFVQK